MTQRSSTFRRPGRDERGVALVVAIAVTFVVILLSLAALRQSMDGITQSGVANKQVNSIDASEAGIQFELDSMNTAVTTSAATFSCPASTTVGTGVTYHLMYAMTVGLTAPVASSLAACAGTIPLTGGDTYLFQSTGTTTSTSFGSRTTQATIYVPPGGTVFDQTVFGSSLLALTNGVNVTAPGTAGGLYSNGNWSCSTQGSITGEVTIYGTTSMNTCSITGDLWSSGAITFNNGSSVSGNTETPARFNGQDPNTNGANSGLLYAGSWINTTCGTASTDFNSCTVYSASTAPTPTTQETFPTVPFVCATPASSNCGSSPWGATWTVDNDVSCNFNNLATDAANGGTGTILYWPASCPVLTTPSNSSTAVTNNLAIIAPSGVNFYNSGNPFTNSTAKTYSALVVVPSSVTAGGTKTTTTCSSGSPMIQANSTLSFPSNLDVGLFTPCDMNFQNGISSMTGQLYAGGTLTKGGNSMTITGVAMSIPGATGGGLGAGGSSTPVLGPELQAANPAGYK